MARPLKPLVRGGGYYPSKQWTPLVYNGGYTTMDGGEPPTPVYWKTVTGASPLALVNALAYSIGSLTQYGKCTQASTPTPSAPVDIMCNNGAVRMVDDELPTGYKRVLGFACDNDSMWEITDFHLKGSDTVRISFEVSAACNVFGCYQGADANDNYDLYVSTTSGSKYLRYGNGAYLSYWSSSNLGQRFDVVYTPTGSQGMPQDSTWSALTFTSENDLLIGSTTLTGSSAKLKGKLYGNIEVDGRLKLIPCERVSDGVLGYYDTYGATFYAPYTGSDGAVSLGYDGSHYALGVVGTPEVLTISGANLLDPSTNNIIIGESINAQGQSATAPNNWRTGYIPVVGSKTYIFYGRRKSDDVISAYCRMNFYKSDKTAITPRPSYTQDTVTVATAPSNAAYVRLSCAPINSQDPITRGTFDEYNWMFAEASAEIPFEPYVTPQTVTDIPMLLSVGDYKDEGEIISGIKAGKVGIHIFDGTESFGKSSAYGAAFYIQSAASVWGAQKEEVLCTHFLGRPRTDSSQPDNTCFFNASGHFYFRVSDNSDAAAFKADLAAKYATGTPVIVLFGLAAETTEQTTAHSLHTVEGDNTVSVTSNVDPVYLAATYASSEE